MVTKLWSEISMGRSHLRRGDDNKFGKCGMN